MVNILRKLFRSLYYAVYGKGGKVIKINNEDYNVSAYVARGINSVIDEVPLELLVNLCRNADMVLDVGGNIGVVAMIVAKKMKPGSRMHSFEPGPGAFRYLADNARVQSGNAKITAHNYAISNENGKIQFTDGADATTNHIADQANANTVAIDAITIDWFCEKHKIAPQVIKVDIEGAEYWALEGMQQTLKNNNCRVLMEIHQTFLQEHNIDSKMFGQIIDAVGYKVYNEQGKQVGNDQVMYNTCVILSRDYPGDDVFKI